VTDLLARFAGMWGKKAGSRIARRITSRLVYAQRRGQLIRNGDFVSAPSSKITIRSRAETGIPAERICPEEYREAVLTVLRVSHSLSRPQLTNAVRWLLGFNRTGATLEAQIGQAIDALLGEGALGEGSTGIVPRH
jgi:hypothetical protein